VYARLAFAVATEVDPQILVVDEILGVGDMGFKEKCFVRMRNFREAGKTILLVTHSMKDVQELCERAILIDHGSILMDGSPDESIAMFKSLLAAPEVVAAH
jgi:ABC-2 type transport system ATP-binding protein